MGKGSYCYVKVHRERREVVVAICDAELLGRTIEEGDLRLEVSREFYGGLKVLVTEIHRYMSEATVINLLGNNVVREAARENQVILQAAIKIRGILHVQLVR